MSKVRPAGQASGAGSLLAVAGIVGAGAGVVWYLLNDRDDGSDYQRSLRPVDESDPYRDEYEVTVYAGGQSINRHAIGNARGGKAKAISDARALAHDYVRVFRGHAPRSEGVHGYDHDLLESDLDDAKSRRTPPTRFVVTRMGSRQIVFSEPIETRKNPAQPKKRKKSIRAR